MFNRYQLSSLSASQKILDIRAVYVLGLLVSSKPIIN
jgi:hypothetical protein